MANEIRASQPRRLNKGRGSKFRVGSRVQQETPEDGWRIYRLKCYEHNNKDKDIRPKN